jgi:mannose-6-phosphate isomerase-like protein (cupin superfamily)
MKAELTRVEKPWGWELWWAHTPAYVAKTLFIRAGEQLSLQYHERKDETIYVQEGEMIFLVDTRDGQGLRELVMKPGDAFHVVPGTIHRMRAVTDVLVLEASTPEVEDVVRLEDSYGRVS